MKFFIIGNDKRSLELSKIYEKENKVTSNMYEADYIIAPVPFSRDGIKVNGTDCLVKDVLEILEQRNKKLISGSISVKVKDELTSKNIEYYDLMQYEDVSIKNAVATAEGAIGLAIQNSKITLKNSNVLIMGYGRIGKILSNILKGFNANIYVEARKEKDLAYIDAFGYNSVDLEKLNDFLPKFDFIFNTIPSIILDEEKLNLIRKDALIVDLASDTGGVDFSVARNLGINVIWALSIPSKTSPKSAAKYFYEEIEKIIKN